MPFISTTDSRWTTLVSDTSHDFYHLPGFSKIEAELLEGEAVGWYGEEGECRCLIPLVKRPIGQHQLHDLVSPYGYPGMVSNIKLSSKQAAAIFKRFHLEAKKEAYISSFVRLNPISNPWNFIQQQDRLDLPFKQFFHGETVSIDLIPSLITIRNNFSENHRRHLKQLLQRGCQLAFNEWSYLDAFIEVYRQTMSRKSALPYYFFPAGYFQKLKEQLGDHLVFITITDKEGQLLSGGLFTQFEKIMQYHLGATLTKALKFSPSKMMMDAAIVYGKLHNAEMLHVGGGLSANTADGLFRFKKGFGSHLHSFSTLRFIHNEEMYEKLIQANGEKHQRTVFFPEYRNL